VSLDSYADAGVLAAVGLVNELPGAARGDRQRPERILPALARILAVDPPSVARLRKGDAPGFLGLARDLRQVFRDLRHGDIDAAASRLNELLSKHPAHPHLAKEDGGWRLHHHPMDVTLVPMWSSICAEAIARMIGAGHGDRFGTCEARDCGRVFFDLSRNASRRFCSTTCQNRVKAAAFRLRQSSASPRSSARKPRRYSARSTGKP
jgi:predicted RNA-binding Zn ribbon-like protein